MKQFFARIIFLISIALYGRADTDKCWQDTARVDASIIDELSGLVQFRAAQFSGYFAMNDSGDGNRFFYIKSNGDLSKTVKIEGWKPYDPEELVIAKCPDNENMQCLVIADIGDNRQRRRFIEIGFVALDSQFFDGQLTQESPKVTPRVLRLNYPDGPHNAEAITILPWGDLLIVTKEQKGIGRLAKSARVYKLNAKSLNSSLIEATKHLSSKKAQSSKSSLLTMNYVTEWPVAKWAGDNGFGGLVTSMALALSQKKEQIVSEFTPLDLVLLTYSGVAKVRTLWRRKGLEMSYQGILESELRFFVIPPLAQQEAISATDRENVFVIGSESPLSRFKNLWTKEKPMAVLREVHLSECKTKP